MKKNINKKINIKIKRKYITLIEILVLFMVAGLTMQIAVAGSSETNKTTEKATAPVISPENPDFVQYHEDKIHSQSTASVKKDKKGFMPASVDLNYLSDISTTGISAPAYYDLRTLNKVTSVKDQGEEGVCWVFATFASLESYLMPGESRDFSENNMKNLLSSAYPEGFDCEPDEGGNPLMSTAYLARWSGPVDETDDPYSIYNGESPQDLPVQKHVQNVLFIPDRKSPLDNDEIKSAILQYGVLCTSMYFDDACFSPTRYSHYYSGSSISDHAVSIVGWDDKFSRDNFSITPPGDGAFIVKNSWGTGWGDNGYFYVSYYDSNIGTNNAVFTAETTENYKKIYQYDLLGWIQSVGYDSPTAWCANVFTAKTDETLEAVSFYAADSNCNYEIYIYIDPESGPVREEGPAFSKSGTIGTAGYHTVPLGSEVQLGAGQKFSVVLKLTTPYCSYPVAVETPFEGFSSKATANLGESFVSEDGNTWEDINVYYPDSNVCIKAFTDPRSIPAFPGYTNPPTDLDHNGLYEDINGNGILDFDDVVAYYDNMEWIEENVPVELFDYNNNGLIDFDDVVKLYDML